MVILIHSVVLVLHCYYSRCRGVEASGRFLLVTTKRIALCRGRDQRVGESSRFLHNYVEYIIIAVNHVDLRFNIFMGVANGIDDVGILCHVTRCRHRHFIFIVPDSCLFPWRNGILMSLWTERDWDLTVCRPALPRATVRLEGRLCAQLLTICEPYHCDSSLDGAMRSVLGV